MNPGSTLRNTLTLIVAVLIGWQILYLIIGDVALRSPLQTFTFAARFMSTPQFAAHLVETSEAFGVALLIARWEKTLMARRGLR